MKVNSKDRKFDTTLGELIATISDAAFEYSDDTKEAYDLARLVLVEILKDASRGSAIFDSHFPTSRYLH